MSALVVSLSLIRKSPNNLPVGPSSLSRGFLAFVRGTNLISSSTVVSFCNRPNGNHLLPKHKRGRPRFWVHLLKQQSNHSPLKTIKPQFPYIGENLSVALANWNSTTMCCQFSACPKRSREKNLVTLPPTWKVYIFYDDSSILHTKSLTNSNRLDHHAVDFQQDSLTRA